VVDVIDAEARALVGCYNPAVRRNPALSMPLL